MTWSLIHSLHQEAESVVKWGGACSEAFKISQGVRQGGILSTDLYKLYGNDQLDRLDKPGLGCHVGEISCAAPACADDITIGTKLKLLTGWYILQVNRAAFNQNQVDPTCMLCQQGPETVDHFLVECSALEEKRRPIMDSIFSSMCELFEPSPDTEDLVQTLLDCSKVIDCLNGKSILPTVKNLEKLSKRLCYTLHTERYKRLKIIPKRLKKISRKGYRRTQKHE